jgi:hypothetical protein
MQRVQDLIAKYNNGMQAPLYVTEMGWPNQLDKRGSTQQLSAGYLARMYLLSSIMPFMKGIWWYDFQDDDWHVSAKSSGANPKPVSMLRIRASKLRTPSAEQGKYSNAQAGQQRGAGFRVVDHQCVVERQETCVVGVAAGRRRCTGRSQERVAVSKAQSQPRCPRGDHELLIGPGCAQPVADEEQLLQ